MPPDDEPIDATELLDQGIRPPSNRERSQLAAHGQVPSGFEKARDRDGLPFSPLIHEIDEDGNPRLTKDKKLRRKRGDQFRTGWAMYQRAQKAQEGAPDAGGNTSDPEPVREVEAVRMVDRDSDGGGGPDDWRAARHPDLRLPGPGSDSASSTGPAGDDAGPGPMEAFRVVALGFAALLAIFLGKKWLMSETEEEAFARTGGEVFKRRGVRDVPPEIGLTATAAGYTTKRVGEDQLARMRAKVRGWFSRAKPAGAAVDYSQQEGRQAEAQGPA